MKWSVLALLLFVAAPALAQNAVTQNGAVSKGHPAIWLQDRQIGDAGGPLGRTSGPLKGQGFAPFSITDSNGIGLRLNTAPTTGAYHTLGIGHDGGGNAVYEIDGVQYPFTGNGNIVGPGSSVIGNAAVWNALDGSRMADPGAPPTVQVATNNDLKALPTTLVTYALRTGYYSTQATPELFRKQTGSCNSNSYVNDGGLCVDANDGNSWVAQPFNNTLNIKNFGCIGDNTADDTDCAGNFLAAVGRLLGAGDMDYGTYKIERQLPTITRRIHLLGHGKVDGGTFIGSYNRADNVGVLALGDGSSGSIIENMSVQTGAGSSGGCVVSIISGGGGGVHADGILLRNLWLTTTGSNTHKKTVCIDGTARNIAPIGVRDTTFIGVDIFGSDGCSLDLKGVVGFSQHGGGIYAAGGTNTLSGSVCVDGTVDVNSWYVTLRPTNINGYIQLAHASFGSLDTSTLGVVTGLSISDDSTVNNWRVNGASAGIIETNWATSSYSGSDGIRHKAITNGDLFVYPGGVMELWKRVTATTVAQTYTFDYTFVSTPRCVAQVMNLNAGDRETADLANAGPTSIDYSTSDAVSHAIDIRCIGIAANGGVLPGYP